MRLELGGRVDCNDGTFGELADVLSTPRRARDPPGRQGAVEPWVERLAPVGPGGSRRPGARSGAAATHGGGGTQRSRGAEGGLLAAGRPPARRSRLGRRHPGGVRASVLPHVRPPAAAARFPVMYDRIPKGDVEIRRASRVCSAEGHHVGDVDGFRVDRDEHITHVVLERKRAPSGAGATSRSPSAPSRRSTPTM